MGRDLKVGGFQAAEGALDVAQGLVSGEAFLAQVDESAARFDYARRGDGVAGLRHRQYRPPSFSGSLISTMFFSSNSSGWTRLEKILL